MQQRRSKTDADEASEPEPRSPQTGQALFGAIQIDEAGVFTISAGGTRHGPRGHWRESEYTQCAIQTIRRGIPSRDADRTKLWRDVNDWLAKDPDFKATGIGEIHRKTVVRVLLKLQRR
jgi:hypothetical protein